MSSDSNIGGADKSFGIIERKPSTEAASKDTFCEIISSNEVNTQHVETVPGNPNTAEIVRATTDNKAARKGRWGWVVTFSAFMVGFILDGMAYSFGVLFIHLMDHFQTSKSETSWIISVMNGTYCVIGPFASVLVGIFGSRKVAIFGASLAAASFFLSTWSSSVIMMILLYGLLGGAGMGLLYLSSLVTVGQYFTENLALATGIAVCGSGIGAFVFAPLSEFLIERYSWIGAMWIISAIVLNGIPMGALLRPIEDTDNTISQKNQTKYCANEDNVNTQTECAVTKEKGKMPCGDLSKLFHFGLLRSPTLLAYGCSCFLVMIGLHIPLVYLPDLALELGMTSQQGAMLISIIGIANTVFRVTAGWMADRPWSDAVIINSVALVIGGGATIFVTKYEVFPIMAVYATIFGASIATFVSLRSIIMVDLLGIEKLTSSLGLVVLFQGLASFIGAPIAGAITDQTGDYKGAFYLTGAVMVLAGIICIPLRRISKWENRNVSEFNIDIEFSVEPIQTEAVELSQTTQL